MEEMNKDFELEMTPLTDAELNEVDGGVGEAGGRWKSVKCARGTVFSVYTGKTSGNYIWASYGGKTGWVDKRFIQYC